MWKLDDYAGVDMAICSEPKAYDTVYHKKELVMVEEGVVYPLKSEYEKVTCTLEGVTYQEQGSLLELPAEDCDVRASARPV